MASYILNLTAGETIEIYADSDSGAIAQVERRFPDCVVADQWDADGINDDGEPCKRLLIWDSEEDADNDDGANAIAELQTIGRA